MHASATLKKMTSASGLMVRMVTNWCKTLKDLHLKNFDKKKNKPAFFPRIPGKDPCLSPTNFI